MENPIQKIKNSTQRYDKNLNQAQDLLNTAEFKVADNLKTEYDMWVWVYQEIANLRMEVSRLGAWVRVNNSTSPNYLIGYHAHLMSLLIPVSVVIPDTLWTKIDSLWHELKTDVDNYFIVRKNVPNIKIPKTLIDKLDRLYRVALLSIQKAGLGFKVSVQYDFEKAIEKAITIS